MPIWEAPGHCTYKAPTCVLLKLDRSFHTFGYDAEENFHIKQDKDDFRSWYFFKNFKMLLYTKKVNCCCILSVTFISQRVPSVTSG